MSGVGDLATATLSLDGSPKEPSERPPAKGNSAPPGPTTGSPGLFAPVRVLAEGAIVADRYRVGRQLGRGGMGEVYEAEDAVLEARVALKTLRHERMARVGAVDAMKRELALARSVNHPNVARVFDFGVHGAAENGIAFMTMELLEGESLSDRVARGPLPFSECMHIARELASALRALHEIGIVHRDLKCSNVILIAREGGFRAIVTDFGLATKSDGLTEEADATEGRITGTPATMSPEQVRGEAITPASDLYSLGVVCFEMLTGRLPFEETTAERTARARLDRDAPNVAELRERIPRDLRRLVMELLAREPKNRPSSAVEVSERLARIERAPKTRRILISAAIALTALGAGGWALRPTAPAPAAPRAEPPVFVLSDLSENGDTGKTAQTLTVLLSEELRSDDAVRSPAPEARAVVSRTLGRITTPSPEDLARARAIAHVDVLAVGTTKTRAETLDLDVALFDAKVGTKIGEVHVSGKSNDLAKITRDAATQIKERLGRNRGAAEGRGEHLVPRDAEAAQDYATALDHRRAFLYADAVAALERVIAREPDFTPAYAELAKAYMSLGRDQEAVDAATHAADRAKSLPRGDELAMYALLAQTKKAWSEAITHYQALTHFYPDRADHVTALGRALVFSGKPAEGVRVLREALSQKHSEWDELTLSLGLAYASGRSSDDAGLLVAATHAEDVARALGATIGIAEAQLHVTDAYLRQGKHAEALPLIDAASATFGSIGDRSSLAGCESYRSRIYLAQGDLVRALESAQRALANARALGNRYLIAHKLTERGIVEAASSRHVAAVATFRESRDAYAAVFDREGVAHCIANAAITNTEIGELANVEADLAEARRAFEDIGMKRGVAEVDLAMGVLRERQGRVDEAVPNVDRAIAILSQVGDAGLHAEAHLARARLAMWRNEPDAASHVTEAVKTVAVADDAKLSADLAMLRSRKAWMDGDIVSSLREADSGVERATASHVPDALLSAEGVQLEASARGHRTLPSVEAIRASVARADALDAIEPRVAVWIGAAIALGGDAELFAKSRALATKHGFVLRGWEIDLTENTLRPTTASRGRAAAVHKAARKTGAHRFE